MNLRKILIIVLCACVCLGVSAQLTARQALKSYAMTVDRGIDTIDMLDAIDYYASGQRREMTAQLGNIWRIDSLSDRHASLTLSEHHSIDIEILDCAGFPLIMLIDRMDTPTTDAIVSFYNSQWQPVEGLKIHTAPGIDDWLSRVNRKTRDDVKSRLPFVMTDAVYDGESGVLTYTFMPGGYITVEDSEVVNEAMAPTIKYKWDGRKFKRIK